MNSDTEVVIRLDYALSAHDGAFIIQNSGDLSIANAEPGKISEITGTYNTTDRYNIIRGEVGGISNKPTVMIQTDPTAISAEATAAMSSNDINFYVEGVPGSLGSATDKKSAQFGGDVRVVGCVERGGILHLSNGGGTPQNYSISGTHPDGVSSGTGPFSTGFQETWVDSIIWNTSIILDPTFYTWTTSGGLGADITILKGGVYKISYSVNLSQLTPVNDRVNMRTFLHDASVTNMLDTIDCSEAWSYGRGSGSASTVSKMTNVCTTTKEFVANDVINLNMVFLHGCQNTDVSINVRADQTWILIERIA
jgi:hypothetical protein